jgi:hypothetical protein
MTSLVAGALVWIVCGFGISYLWSKVASKSTPKPLNELDSLIKQERFNQAMPMVVACADNLPVDASKVALIVYYHDGSSMEIHCARPVKMGVEP